MVNFRQVDRNPAEDSGKLPESGNESGDAVNPAEMPRR